MSEHFPLAALKVVFSEACLSPQSLNGINHSISHNKEPASLLNNVSFVESTSDWAQMTWIQVPVLPPSVDVTLAKLPNDEESQVFVCEMAYSTELVSSSG